MIPSRGSKEAMAAGCYCPIGTWTSPHCPVHDADDTYQCPNCIRLEADLEREQEAGLLRKAERDRLVKAVKAFLKCEESIRTPKGMSFICPREMREIHIEGMQSALKEISE